MSSIPNNARKAIDTIVARLSDVANAVERANPIMASIYRAIGKAIDGSHYKFQGGFHLQFEFPKGCSLTLLGSDSSSADGPVTLSVTVK